MIGGEPETVVSASLQKIKSIRNPIKKKKKIFNFIKSETSDSFVNHFDGHFAYLKTLDFYFKECFPQGILSGLADVPSSPVTLYRVTWPYYQQCLATTCLLTSLLGFVG